MKHWVLIAAVCCSSSATADETGSLHELPDTEQGRTVDLAGSGDNNVATQRSREQRLIEAIQQLKRGNHTQTDRDPCLINPDLDVCPPPEDPPEGSQARLQALEDEYRELLINEPQR